LGHQDNDPLVAPSLGLPVPRKGQFVTARVVPRLSDDDRPFAEIGGLQYVVARPAEPFEPAPAVPRK
jgi:hypothetical protein